MSKTLQRIRELVGSGEVRISDHGYDELAEDGIFAREVIASVREAILIEDYPDYPKGPCVLLLQKDKDRKPIHVVWGIPKMRMRLLWWSPPIGRMQINGQTIF